MSFKPLVEKVIETLVLEPEAVSVEEVEDRGAQVYHVTVAPNDVGRVIGKDGRVISCVRQLVDAAAAKAKVKAHVKVVTE